MRKKSRAMDSGWALEILHKAPYITVSFIDEDGNSRFKRNINSDFTTKPCAFLPKT